jgi:hypothetical protein
MRQYLSTLHSRSETHKKRFAFLVSGGFTLMMFSLWTLATFGTGGRIAQEKAVVAQKEEPKEVTPLASLKNGVATGLAGISEALRGLFPGGEDEAQINIYGR